MKRQYVKPACVTIKLAMQQPCLINGSYKVEEMGYNNEQTIGGDE